MLQDGEGLAHKTGTSWGFRDAWAVGVAGDLVIAVWVGHFDGRSNPALIGRQAALPLLRRLAAGLVPRRATPEPLGLQLARIEMCVVGGEIAGRHCPRAEPGWYLPGVSPLRVNDVHREVPVRVADGLRDCVHRPPATRLELHEFWPSHLRRLYERAGRVRRQPPPLAATCDETLGRGQAPRILAPTAGVDYVQRTDTDAEPVPIPLQAAVDAEVREVYWFVGRRLVVHGDAGETLFWIPEPGRHQLRIVDDHGRSAAMVLTVTP
jgi:penicillin-binding protein 1C